jgi:hypothetical protein
MRFLFHFGAVVCLCFVLGACTASTASTSADQPVNSSAQNYEDLNYYYEFDDILIPKELDFQSDDSYTLDNRKFRVGIMKFTGRVEIPDLLQFFLNNMAKDNWEKIAAVKGKTSILSFEKFNKSCVIQVEDTFARDTVTIIAVETKDGSGSETDLAK